MTTITSDNQYACHDLSVLYERENHNFAQSKLTLQNIVYHQRKNSLEQAAFWLQINVVLPTDPLFTCKTDNIYNLTDRRSAINRQEGGIAASKVCLKALPFPFPLLPTFLPFPQTESLFTGYMLHIPNSTKRKKKDHNIQYV